MESRQSEVHDPLTCDPCHAEGVGAEIAAVESERDHYKATLLRFADWIERDRRESDKVLVYAQSMRREAQR